MSAEGEGQALWFPYYTVNGNHDTYFSLSNTSWLSKAVKVRFLEARHGRPVLDLAVYLAPHASWTAAIYQTSADSPPVLRTSDLSCTTPAIPSEGLRFTTASFDGTGSLPADDAPEDVGRTREGSIEVIAGGDIGENTPTASAIMPTSAGAAPSGCAILPAVAAGDLIPPDNALYGSAAIIDVEEGEYYAYNADAIADFTDTALMASPSGPLEPSLAQGNTGAYYFADGSGARNLAVRTAEMDHGIDAVTALFVADTISNDFLVSRSLGAKTDWVVSYPTKRFYVDPVYSAVAAGAMGATAQSGTFHVDAFDRDAASALPAPTNVTLPYDLVNVLIIGRDDTAASLFGSQFTASLPISAEAGMIRLRTAQQGSPGPGMTLESSGDILYGSAVSGFMAYNIVNADAQPNRLANYGAAFRHHLTKCDGPVVFPASCRRWP
ncbi:MAG TPA: hypothetical protein VGC30_00410 [Dokdonella sp.]